MQLENTFTVPAGIDEAWAAFNDPRRVAPCFPGATLDSYEDDSFTGTVKVKLGPISRFAIGAKARWTRREFGFNQRWRHPRIPRINSALW